MDFLVLKVKYMGSKSRIAKHIVPIIQKYIDDNNAKYYYEPFLGGANIIDKIKCENKIGSDLNKYLIALLNQVKNKQPLYGSVSKDLYDKARIAFYNNDSLSFEDWQIGCIGFLASYNGRGFSGGYAKSGYEQTKTGERYRDYYQEAKRNILAQSDNLQDINMFAADYKDLYNTYHFNNVVVYCDPPYKNTKQYGNSKYFDYDEFWNCMREWSRNNIVLISELEAPDDFICIWKQEVSRSIKANDKSKATEKLFIYNVNN